MSCFGRRAAGHRTLVTGSDTDPDGPAGPQPSRRDKRWYFALMATCIRLFVLSWAVIDPYSALAAGIVSAVAPGIPPLSGIIPPVGPAPPPRRPRHTPPPPRPR